MIDQRVQRPTASARLPTADVVLALTVDVLVTMLAFLNAVVKHY
jgi:hypothetical protein